MKEENDNRIDRRKGPDFWVKAVGYSRFIVWLLVLLVLFFLSFAKPEMETFFDRMLHVNVRKTWNNELVKRAVYISILVYFLCASAFIVNSTRKKRKEDRYSITLILMGIISFVGVVLYLLNVL
ncbi:MAG: hypothetical protein GX660_04000 [Clostridiaceae bacterium]|nr:hypothetical protein [Clostridiaceae bacterium]